MRNDALSSKIRVHYRFHPLAGQELEVVLASRRRHLPITVRGLDVLDARNGGFVAPSCDSRQQPPEGFCFDTRLVGNSNDGHVYGTALPASDKSDLLAYLLTL